MKPAIVADEMFPEGAGPYMDIEELTAKGNTVGKSLFKTHILYIYRPYIREAGGSSALLMDLAANEKSVHADFFNDFEDLFDDDDVA